MTSIVNKYKSSYEVYIGRGSVWGNPFVIGKDGSREEVIEKYKGYFNNKISNDVLFLNQTLNLKNKILGCFCKPLACHGDVIVEFLENPELCVK